MNDKAKIFTFEEIEELANTIGKIKQKTHLKVIGNIIMTNNPNISVTRTVYDSSYLCFDKLTNDTYTQLHDYIKKIKLQGKHNDGTKSAEYVPYSKSEYPFEGNAKLRYSNREKNLIKRKQYDKEINNTDDQIQTLSFENRSQVNTTSNNSEDVIRVTDNKDVPCRLSLHTEDTELQKSIIDSNPSKVFIKKSKKIE